MTQAMTKADKVRQAWGNYIAGVRMLHPADGGDGFYGMETDVPGRPGTPASVRLSGYVLLNGRHYGISRQCRHDEPSRSSLLEGILDDAALAEGMPVLCDLAARSGSDALGHAEDATATMTFLSDTEKTNLIPRLSGAWSKKIGQHLAAGGLDVDVLQTIGAALIDPPSIQSYNYYTGYGAVPDEVKARRLEAARHYPLLSNMIATRIPLRRAVDANEPLAAAITAASPLTRDGKPLLPGWLIRRLGETGAVKPSREALEVFSALPPDWFPADDHEMACANEIIDTLGPVFNRDYKTLLTNCDGKWSKHRDALLLAYADTRPPEGCSKEAFSYLGKAINFDAIQALSRQSRFDEVRAVAARIGGSIPLPADLTAEGVENFIKRKYAPFNGGDALGEIADVANSLIDLTRSRMLLPAAMHAAGLREPILTGPLLREAEDQARALLIGGRSALAAIRQFRGMNNAMVALVNVGRRDAAPAISGAQARELGYHTFTPADIQIMSRMRAWSAGEASWPTLTGPVMIGDYAIVPLVSVDDVSYEAQMMSHCLGDYHVAQAKNLSQFHYGIRRLVDGWPEHIATFTLETNLASAGIRMTEIKAKGNTTRIPVAAKAAVHEFMNSEIAAISPSIAQAHSQVQAAQAEAAAQAGMPARYEICGYDWRKSETLKDVFKIYGPAFPKPIQKDFARFLESDSVKTIAGEIDPAGRARRRALSPSV